MIHSMSRVLAMPVVKYLNVRNPVKMVCTMVWIPTAVKLVNASATRVRPITAYTKHALLATRPRAKTELFVPMLLTQASARVAFAVL